MPNNIYHKRNANSGVVPTAAQLTVGEIALNTADGKAYTRTTAGNVVELTEASVADGGEQVTPLSVSNLALWLDAGDLTPGAVATWTDKSANGRVFSQSVEANRPVATPNVINGRQVIRFDGSNDWLSSSGNAANLLYPVTFFIVGRKTTNTIDGGLFTHEKIGEHSYNSQHAWAVTTNSTTFALRVAGGPDFSPLSFGVGSNTDVLGSFICTFRIAGNNNATVRNRTNGQTANDTEFTLSATPVNTGCAIGALSGLSGAPPALAYYHRLNGDIAEIIAYSRALSDAEQNLIVSYLSQKYGLALPPTVSNLDAQNWINRVYQNNGTVSQSTAAAVNTFCNAIDSAGLRDRFYRLNLFCGNNLAACLVPLYRGPSLGGTQFGNATDTNNNFAASDYNERGVGGLRGDGSSKYLNTGLSISNIGTFSSGHLSVYHGQSSGNNTNRYYIAANDSLTSNRYWFGTDAFSSAIVIGLYGHVFTASESLPTNGHGTAGHRILSRTASNSLTHYHNGSVVATDTNDVAGGAGTLSTAALTVFAFNNNGTISRFHNSWIAAYSIGLGLDATQAAAYRTAMQAFQTTLARNV